MTTELARHQSARFQQQGYLLHKEQLFEAEDFAALQRIFEEDYQQYGEDDLDTIHFRDERLLPFLLHPRVLDLVESLIGPDIGLWSSHFIVKPPGAGKATPWHEDSAYWRGRVSEMAGIVTVWLAIDRVSAENGAMRVIPGSHALGGDSSYEDVTERDANIFSRQVRAEDVPEERAVDFVLEPGECSVHDARIIHGARANTSQFRRAGYTMRYFPTTSLVVADHPGNDGHRIWLARGTDRAGNAYVNA